MLQVLRHAVLLQRVQTLDPTVLTAEKAIEMATLEGARYVGIDAGQIAVGKLADIIVLDLDRPQSRPFNHAVGTIAYHGRGSDVVMTIVGGEIVYEDGRCTRIDEASAMEEAQARSEEMFERLDFDRFKRAWHR